MTAKSTRKARSGKPAKPRPDFPLFPHATQRWAKKVRGKFHYFGKVSPDGDHGAQAALERWLAQKDDLLAGRTPRGKGEGLTVRELVNRFLTVKQAAVESGELSPRSFQDYHTTCGIIVGAFGRDRLVSDLASDDFEALRASIAKNVGPVRLGNEVQRVRVTFKYAYDAGLIEHPIRFGPTFKRPSKKVLRRLRTSKGPRMFEAPEIRRLLDAAGEQLRAMILLGVNCGFGNSDCANLPTKALDLERGWVSFPRPKTGVERRCPLWSETIAALREWLPQRPEPKNPDHAGLVFVTKYGDSWAKETSDNPISKETAKLLDALGLHRRGLGFYTLRHVFATIGGDTGDQVAVSAIMGHVDESMAGVYRERIGDARLEAVAEHVRRWLFDSTKTE